ncbi:hypothetical protein H2201_004841 [Coniosporium apollinis]|uniref:Stc1 domain-containing protein n=1 Tax=Coniosporium apollinis TaxID=61459 RepID=A0ABQ9NS45_9PEZI|nr:hypothetical protein H2201_004841 [Coniosporium apollinis]
MQATFTNLPWTPTTPTPPPLGLPTFTSNPIPTGLDPDLGFLYPPILPLRLSLRGLRPQSTTDNVRYDDYRWTSIRVCGHVQLYCGRKLSPAPTATCGQCGGQPDEAIRNKHTQLKRLCKKCARCNSSGKNYYLRSDSGDMAEWALVWAQRVKTEKGEGDCHQGSFKRVDALKLLSSEVREDIGRRERRQPNKARMEREMRTLMLYTHQGRVRKSRDEEDKRQEESQKLVRKKVGL